MGLSQEWQDAPTTNAWYNSTPGRIGCVFLFIFAYSVLSMFAMESPPPERFRKKKAA